ncbi:S8 family serine peptidase [Pirellulaceae bacterium SH467]
MAKKSYRGSQQNQSSRLEAAIGLSLTSTPDELLLAALERGSTSFETGRFLVSYKGGMEEAGIKGLSSKKLRIANARDYEGQAVQFDSVGDAQALVFPEIGVALLTAEAMLTAGLSNEAVEQSDSSVDFVEPEYFVFTQNAEYLRGFLSAAKTIAHDIAGKEALEEEPEAEVLGATWGLMRCRVPASGKSGSGIKVAVLDTGMDLGHPDFVGRSIVSSSFVGQPVQDLNGHGTHCIGTACGPKAPSGSTPRYGIAFGSRIFAGKVLSNSGNGTGAGVLAGMNWAISQRCEIISMSLGSQSPVQATYTNAGAAALRNGLLIVAAAGNASSSTAAPANSPTIMSVASLDTNLAPSNFSNFGKIEIAAPGRDVFSSWPRPTVYRTISGTSMATPHVAGCAALWAQSSARLRGMTLWQRLQSSAQRLPHPSNRVGAGLVVSPP